MTKQNFESKIQSQFRRNQSSIDKLLHDFEHASQIKALINEQLEFVRIMPTLLPDDISSHADRQLIVDFDRYRNRVTQLISFVEAFTSATQNSIEEIAEDVEQIDRLFSRVIPFHSKEVLAHHGSTRT